jgi:hypothetical protein
MVNYDAFSYTSHTCPCKRSEIPIFEYNYVFYSLSFIKFVVEFQLFSRRQIGPTLQNHTIQIRNKIKKRETMKHIL